MRRSFRSWVARFGALTLALSFLTACPEGEGAIFLTVDAAGGTTLTAVDSLRLTIQNGGQTSLPISITLAGAPVSLPPARTIPLRFSSSRRGETSIVVEAVRGGGTLAMGTTIVTLRPGKSVDAAVTLAGAVVVDADLGDGGLTDLGDSDLFGADLAVSADLALPEDLLSEPADLVPSPDLSGCTPAPPKPGGTVVYLSPTGTGDGDAPTTATNLVGLVDLIDTAGANPITVLAAEGNYSRLQIDSRTVTLMGGYYAQFACRDPGTRPTIFKSETIGVAALAVMGSKVAFDGVRAFGRTDPGLGNPAVGMAVIDSTAAVVGSRIFSHEATTIAPALARGLVIRNSTVEVTDTQIQAQIATNTLEVVSICNTKTGVDLGVVKFVRSDIVAGGNLGIEPRGIASTGVGCKGLNLVLDHTKVRMTNTVGAGIALLASASDDVVRIALENSLLLATGPYGQLLLTEGTVTPSVTIYASTLSASPSIATAGAGAKAAMQFEAGANLELTESLVQALYPFRTFPMVTSSRDNLFFGSETDKLAALGATPTLAAYLGSFESTGTASTLSDFADPKVGADGYHLQGISPARGMADCPFTTDIDNAARPTTNCDIGADQFSP